MSVRRTLIALLCAALVACGGNTRAPVEDRNVRKTTPEVVLASTRHREYRVQRGDTLYSIAFRYGLDFRKVAAVNRIAAPYTIYVGQLLQLREASVAAVTRPYAPQSAPMMRAPSPVSLAAGSSSKTSTVAKPVSKPAPRARPVYTGGPVGKWLWPTAGRVTRGYSSKLHKGIDIGGKRGDAIVACAPGKVVYSGTGIVGFGELLIIKHNEEYLSAYGHNDRLLVREGDVVKAGQAIAHKGNSGTDTINLHFEIRREGKPIDPQRVLPKR